MKPQQTLIIAEAGVNHNGSISKAKKLIQVAAEAGANYVKFQTFKAENLVKRGAGKAEYQKTNTKRNESQYKMLKRLELSLNDHLNLIDFCKTKSIKFLSSGFDIESINLLEKINTPIFKIPSGEITNFPYLETIGAKSKPIIMSTGMSTLNEVRKALDILLQSGAKKNEITLLHCNSEYPTPMEDVNLKAMITMKEEFGVSVGYSDHTQGIEISIAAVGMGADVIEKHFTLDRNLPGPDHSASLEPNELKSMISAIRNIEIGLGSGIKTPSQSEIKNIVAARKSIVAKCKIKKGEKFTEKNITTKRPGKGISPTMWNIVVGSFAKQNFKKNDFIKI